LPVFAQEETEKQEADTKAATTESEVKTTVKAAPKEKAVTNPKVVLETNHGNITLELFMKQAPISVDNFLTYVRDGFYDGTVFHRVIDGFVLQAGGMNGDLQQKKPRDPIKNEATNGLKNERGTLSMARTNAINSGTSHFFINLIHNTSLDHVPDDPTRFGYAVFGKVTEGMDVVDKIAKVKVGDKGRHQNVPVKPVMIKKATVIGETEEAKKVTEDEAPKKETPEEAAETKVKELKKEAKKIKDE
jgi:cyclophilin family peptidyl-prolyl cis-trans isomerase